MKPRAPKPNLKRLRAAISYNPNTGALRWRRARYDGRWLAMPFPYCGKLCGSLKRDGRRVIRFEGVRYEAHYLAWYLHYGRWPRLELARKNGRRDDNRIANIREETFAQHGQKQKTPKNNTSGFKGVDFHKASGKWRARIRVNGRPLELGLFDTVEAAGRAYADAAQKYFGEFANIGRKA